VLRAMAVAEDAPPATAGGPGGRPSAIAPPGLAILGGWDGNRWLFLIMVNFFIVVWIALGDRGTRELNRSALVILATALLMLGHFSIYYFDD
jgi:hypothetical protein